MTPETFFENFGLIAEAPNGIKKLREMILQLAVQGKLVPQDPKDEPANELLKKIKAEKDSLIKDGKIKKEKLHPLIRTEDMPYVLPHSWEWTKLGNLTYIRTGKLDANASNPNGIYPFFTCAKDPLRIDHYSYNCECVLLAGNGNFDVNYYHGKFEAYQRTYIIEPINRILLRIPFLYRYIQNYSKVLRDMSIGGVISYIKIGFLTEALFPLPPLNEQHRIVEKVDQLMALCDELEEKQARRSKTRTSLTVASFQALAEAKEKDEFRRAWERVRDGFGFLTETPESIKELQQTILQLAVKGWFTGKCFPSIPETKISDFIYFQNGYAFKSNDFSKKGVRLLRNINIGHGNIIWEITECIPFQEAKKYESFRLKKNNIVLSLDRPIIQGGLKIARVSDTNLPSLLLQRVARVFIKNDDLLMDYFYLWLQSSAFISNIDPGRSKGVPHISTKQIKAIPFYCPSKDEQKVTIDKTNKLIALCHDIDQSLKDSEYFSSKLTTAMTTTLIQ